MIRIRLTTYINITYDLILHIHDPFNDISGAVRGETNNLNNSLINL